MLCFHQTTMQENRNYILYGSHYHGQNPDKMDLSLYEETNSNDIKSLTVIPQWNAEQNAR